MTKVEFLESELDEIKRKLRELWDYAEEVNDGILSYELKPRKSLGPSDILDKFEELFSKEINES